MTAFPYKSSHLLIDTCENPSLFHITLFAQTQRILFLDFMKNDQSISEKIIHQEEIHSFDIVKKKNQSPQQGA